MGFVWKTIIIYWLMWPILGGVIALGLVINIIAGWECFKHSEPIDYPFPYESFIVR